MSIGAAPPNNADSSPPGKRSDGTIASLKDRSCRPPRIASPEAPAHTHWVRSRRRRRLFCSTHGLHGSFYDLRRRLISLRNDRRQLLARRRLNPEFLNLGVRQEVGSRGVSSEPFDSARRRS